MKNKIKFKHIYSKFYFKQKNRTKLKMLSWPSKLKSDQKGVFHQIYYIIMESLIKISNYRDSSIIIFNIWDKTF